MNGLFSFLNLYFFREILILLKFRTSIRLRILFMLTKGRYSKLVKMLIILNGLFPIIYIFLSGIFWVFLQTWWDYVFVNETILNNFSIRIDKVGWLKNFLVWKYILCKINVITWRWAVILNAKVAVGRILHYIRVWKRNIHLVDVLVRKADIGSNRLIWNLLIG